MRRGVRRSWGHTLVAALVAVLCLVCLAQAVNDHAQLHSFYPPILQHYWQNGFLFWSFGKQTVVTDKYVRLTENAAGSSGYLWNRHENHMGSFELTVTARMLDRDGSWFSSGNAKNGLGIWYAIKSSKPLADTSFYGFERAFDGFGVVLDHSNKITLYVGNGKAGEPRPMASCAVSSLKENFITISITSDDQQDVTVSYTKHNEDDLAQKNLADHSAYTTCLSTRIQPFAPNTHRHFGVTASNGAEEQTVHDIHSIFMIPLSNVEAYEEEVDHVRTVHLFDKKAPSGAHDDAHVWRAGDKESADDQRNEVRDTPSPKPAKKTKKGKKRRAPQ